MKRAVKAASIVGSYAAIKTPFLPHGNVPEGKGYGSRNGFEGGFLLEVSSRDQRGHPSRAAVAEAAEHVDGVRIGTVVDVTIDIEGHAGVTMVQEGHDGVQRVKANDRGQGGGYDNHIVGKPQNKVRAHRRGFNGQGEQWLHEWEPGCARGTDAGVLCDDHDVASDGCGCVAFNIAVDLA